MEILLAIVVASAVILFGALISMGNERQRKAIDGLREQVVLWAVQDLQIKRDRLARDIKVENPIGWLNKIASRVSGFDLDLQSTEFFDRPQCLLCTSTDGSSKIIFAPLSPLEIYRFKKGKNSRLCRFTSNNPLLSLPKNTTTYEISTLQSGLLFDLELAVVWKELTSQSLETINRFWIYEYS